MSVSRGRLSPTLTFRNKTRASPGPSNSWRSGINNDTSVAASGNRVVSLLSRFQKRKKVHIYLCIFSFSFLAFFLLSAYNIIPDPTRFERVSLPANQTRETLSLSRSSSKSLHMQRESSSSSLSIAEDPYKPFRNGKVPVVYRTILERLENLDHEQAALVIPAAAPSFPSSIPFVNAQTESTLYSLKHSMADVCGDYPQPCRFLLLLRIAEQESKARIHLLEIIQTAKRLDRILILPHVGRSRLGLCFRWSFESYYDEDLLLKTLNDEGVRAVTLDAFKLWIESGPFPAPRGQLLSLGFKPDADADFSGPLVRKFTDEKGGLIIGVDIEPITSQDSRFPGCFAERFGSLLSSEFTPISISPSPMLNKSLRKQPIGEDILDVLARADIRDASRFNSEPVSISPYEASEPEVLMLDWGLRHPVFRQAFRGYITYSPWLEQLAKKVSPASPYLMIHWRMESVSPEVLPDCAHDLVDTISNLLHTPGLGDDIHQVWFAGDYPFPIVDHLHPLASDGTHTPTGKSGTFREFGGNHTKAVGILVDAFREGAALDRWEITDLAAELVRINDELTDVNPDFLDDSGALGILDKIIGMNAALFVAGAKGCGRASSFTEQVIDSRWEGDASRVRNVVEHFG